MKFTSKFTILYTIYFITFLFSINQACEQSCRDGISLAFCNNYAQEWNPLFDTLGKNLTSNLYDGVTDNVDQVKNLVDKAVLNQVNKSRADFTSSCKFIVQESIFSKSPQFKGQCQKPLRVIQPKPGVNWTLSDCQNQDYICGNPPSICHFMNEYVKPRNVDLLKEALTERISDNGNFTSSLIDITNQTVTNSGAFDKSQTQLDNFMGIVTKNIKFELNQFGIAFNSSFCAPYSNNSTSCDKYDSEIKSILLSYP
ncbi:hypothetical protein RclHR1_00500019 [Rhizophagus clarus]|uniref:Uncharacterized protein n=1 Tax=Rhizophagus clarus TaxID=94130 RepID=A0A2Z6RLX1_9GLOM|nr:hypothetical protein RclHR1_00500019 [Rhizophagus clarus]GES97486.1 hypothetical protein GLOIN_2v1657012 [Rhizophagus clarus]